ncbi:hypothetical protein KEM48_007925 [Puccinia striiformis f. sp. tritici PST-130]|nr:hypothetical protein KEM48_007925 [Puccinia striiformis f. sp. tritici PST-130]
MNLCLLGLIKNGSRRGNSSQSIGCEKNDKSEALSTAAPVGYSRMRSAESWGKMYPTLRRTCPDKDVLASSSAILFTTFPNLRNLDTWESATYFHRMRDIGKKKQISFGRSIATGELPFLIPLQSKVVIEKTHSQSR